MADDLGNIERKRGDTYPEVVTLYANGAVLDLQGVADLKLGISDKKAVNSGGGGKLLATLEGVLGVDENEGRVVFTVPADIPAGRHYGEITYSKNGFTYSTPTFEVNIIGDII